MDDIKTVSIGDAEYPGALKKIANAPKTLYFKGALPKPDEICVAVVGCRRCSDYGKSIAGNLASDLASAGITVVSGLAPGIDTVAHQAVVERGARTIAVLGTGVDEKSLYPQENIGLALKIIETGGCVMSEYPAGTPGAKFTFPSRNRIVAGLSRAVVVVEAKQKSGALITANWARLQKKIVFAVPGSIFSQNSRGCHFLIKQGAKLAENMNDILKELAIQAPLANLLTKKQEGANNEEKLILECLKQGPAHIDKIIENTKLSAKAVAGALMVMELESKAKNLGGSVYTLSR